MEVSLFRMFEYIKNKKLDELFRLTADAFQSEIPALSGLSFAERLSKYASFTKEQAEKVLMSEGPSDEKMSRLKEVEEKLYQNSFLFGKRLRKYFHVRTQDQAIRVLGTVYKMIGIEFQCGKPLDQQPSSPDGIQHNGQCEFVIRECYFSSFYSAEVCRLISSLDEGLAAGLSGGGILSFTHRITEGCGCCKGSFVQKNR